MTAAPRLGIGQAIAGAMRSLAAWKGRLLVFTAIYALAATLLDRLLGLAGTLIVSSIGFVITALLTHNALRARYQESYQGKPFFARTFGMYFLTGIAMMLGFCLFIIPGIFVLMIWAVALPAMMRDNSPIFDALEHSNLLIKGNRWPVFVLLALLFILYLGLSLALILAALALMDDSAAEPIAFSVLSNAIVFAYEAFSCALWVEVYALLTEAHKKES